MATERMSPKKQAAARDSINETRNKRLLETQESKSFYTAPKAQRARDTLRSLQRTPSARKVLEEIDRRDMEAYRKQQMRAFLNRQDTI